MRLDWARYSAEDTVSQGGHRWREGSRPEAACPRALKSYTELPAYAEGQRNWTPFYSGLATGDELALIFVEPNTTPGRANRVNARVLFVPVTLDDLTSALSVLRDPSQFIHPAPVEIPSSTVQPSVSATVEVAQVLQAFSEARGQRIVLRSEEEMAFLAHFWRILWAGARHTLTFRRHFHPRELPEQGLNPQLILVPDAAPWQRERQVVLANQIQVNADQGPQIGESESALFSGDLTHLRLYQKLQQALETPFEQQDVRQLQHAWGLMESVPMERNYRAAQLSEIRTALQRRIPAASADELLSLMGIEDASGALESAVAQWVTQTLGQGTSAPDAAWTDQMVSDKSWLGTGLRRGLEMLIPSSLSAQALVAWLFWESGRSLLDFLEERWQDELIRQLPGETVKFKEPVVWTRQRAWWNLHATLIVRQNPEKGVRDILHFTEQSALQDALKAAEQEIPLQELLKLLSAANDPRTVPFGSQALVSDSQIMAWLNPKVGWWRQVWTRALPGMHDPFRDVPHPSQLVDGLLDALLRDADIPLELVQAIAQTPEADILRRSDRSELWNRLPPLFLETSAAAYVRVQDDPGAADSTLLCEIIRQGQQQISRAASLRLVDHLNDLHPDQARALLQQWPEQDKERVLQFERRQPNFIATLFSVAVEYTPDWALNFLPDGARLELAARRGQNLPDDLWWHLAHHLIPDAVHESPMQFWVAAGGKSVDLEQGGSTRERWAAALERSRGGAMPHVTALLDEILLSYPNTGLRHLRQTQNAP